MTRFWFNILLCFVNLMLCYIDIEQGYRGLAWFALFMAFYTGLNAYLSYKLYQLGLKLESLKQDSLHPKD